MGLDADPDAIDAAATKLAPVPATFTAEATELRALAIALFEATGHVGLRQTFARWSERAATQTDRFATELGTFTANVHAAADGYRGIEAAIVRDSAHKREVLDRDLGVS